MTMNDHNTNVHETNQLFRKAEIFWISDESEKSHGSFKFYQI